MKDARLIRHLGKLRAVHANAAAVLDARRGARQLRRLSRGLARARASSRCGTISPSAFTRWAAIRRRASCAWPARTLSC